MMREVQLTGVDRFWRFVGRHIDRRALQFVANQAALRVLFNVAAQLGSARPAGTQVIADDDGSLWITPKGVAPTAGVLMYLHGGGFTIGSPQTHAALVAHLAQAAGLRAYVPRYRLAPEHPFPAAKEDAIAAYDRLVAQGTPPVALAGDSAGGCLALQVACHARDSGGPLPQAMGLIGPIADLSGDIVKRFADAPGELLIHPAWPERILAAYLPGHDLANAAISPIKGELSGLPPTLIQAGAEEVLAQDAVALQDALDDVQLELWPGLPHVWHIHAGRAPAADLALSDLGQFLATRVAEATG